MSSPRPTLKKQQTPLVVWFRLYGHDKADMLSLTGKRRGAHNTIAMTGTLAEVARLKAAASPVSPATAKAVAEFIKVTNGADPAPVLRAAMRDYILRLRASHGAAGAGTNPP